MANMLALISLENKELCPVLEAHIYTVCPTAIPQLPTPSSDASEEALMKSLGMAKDKNGEYETFSRFLLRTEVNQNSVIQQQHVPFFGCF
jgi:GLE1-like protein